MKTSYKNIAVVLLLFLVGKLGFSNISPILPSNANESTQETLSGRSNHALGYFVETEALNLVFEVPEDTSPTFLDTVFTAAKLQSSFINRPDRKLKQYCSANLIAYRLTREILFPFHSFW